MVTVGRLERSEDGHGPRYTGAETTITGSKSRTASRSGLEGERVACGSNLCQQVVGIDRRIGRSGGEVAHLP